MHEAHGHRALKEIERKFLLNGLPAFDRPDSIAEIEQGYLPGERVIERLRRVRADGKEELFRTVKEGSGMTRLEVEEPIPVELFDQLWPLTEGRRIRKHRHRVKDRKLTWEVDEFQDRDLVIAEVELPSPSAEVSVPDWLRPHIVREVTDDSKYSNYRLACDSEKDEESAPAIRPNTPRPSASERTGGRVAKSLP